MEHTMKLSEESFYKLKEGKKQREYRLYDEKRKQVRIGDTIKFLKLPDLKESFIVEVKNIEIYPNWQECYQVYFAEDFNNYQSIEEIVKDTYQNYYSKEESEKNECVVFTIKKQQVTHFNATACYLKKENQLLMIKFNKKWGQVYAPPGGKFEVGESPLDCITREFFEETGLTLIQPKLQGISYWKDSVEGIIFVYTAEDFIGDLKESSEEGTLEWISMKDMSKIKQFAQNEKFMPYLFQNELFEGKFLLDEKCQVLNYEIRIM